MTMRPPDQIPNRQPTTLKQGDTAFVWTGTSYAEKTFIRRHDWQKAVTLRDGIGQIIVKAEDVIDAAQFKSEQREERRIKYADLIALWECGVHDPKELAGKLHTCTSGAGSMVRAAKAWQLIAEDAKPPTETDLNAPGEPPAREKE